MQERRDSAENRLHRPTAITYTQYTGLTYELEAKLKVEWKYQRGDTDDTC